MNRVYEFPAYIEPEIKKIFTANKWEWNSRRLAEDVLQLSDYYIHNPDSSTPWDKAWAQRALLVYFWPLNSIRYLAVHEELKKVGFFQGLNQFLDFGAGPGTAAWILKQEFQNVELMEQSLVPQEWFPQFQWTQKPQVSKESCAVFCYSMTELAELPQWAYNSEALIILEPATQQDGRKLLELRQKLLEKGYNAWAPCPHQEGCPLLVNSKHDWCHDRVEIQAPRWFQEIENYLPMKNRTITMSYVGMRKKAPIPPTWARLVGDQLNEKGKSRQMVCRSSSREFLAWMHRDGTPPEFFRGERVLLEEFEPKSNELRVKKISRI